MSKRLIRRRLFSLSVLWLLGGHPASAEPDRLDVTATSSTGIAGLQARLKDDGCYAGAVDGQASAATKAAIAECPDQRPQLRIETGMHVANIYSVGVDAACKIAVTGSDDKTVRLWSLPDGRPLRVLRWPIEGGDIGKVYSVVVSPDGRIVVAGGAALESRSAKRVALTVFDAATGAVTARVGGLDEGASYLAFSNDGRWLAVSLIGRQGVRMIDTSTWQVVAEDRAYRGDSHGAVFGPDGRLYMTGWDGRLRRYGPGPRFAKEGEITTRGGSRPSVVTIDPQGERLAVAFGDSPVVDLYDAASMRLIRPIDMRRYSADGLAASGALAWNRDGSALLVGVTPVQSKPEAFLLDREGQFVSGPFPIGRDNVTSAKACGAGFALTASDPAFGLLDGEGRTLFWRSSLTADMRGNVGNVFTVSADARRVRYNLEFGAARPVLFDLTAATLTDSPDAPSGLIAPVTEGLGVANWFNTFRPSLRGRPLPLTVGEASRSMAIRPEGDGLVIGGSYRVAAFDAGGRQRWKFAGPGVTWGLNMSADGRVIVALHGDGTMRWYRWSDGQELLALFVDVQTRAWVAWTPSGYYMASPGGEDMIGWHVNRGWAQVADFFPASKFRDQFSRPDVVERVLDTLDEAEALKQADAARGSRVVPARPLLERLPPVIDILSPAPGANVGDDVQVDYLVRSPSNLPVDAVETLIDGRPPSASRGLARVSKEDALAQCLAETRGLGRTEGALQGCRSSVKVHLPAGAREIGLFVRSGDRTSEVVRVQVIREAVARGAPEPPKSKLYALVVGISAYANADYALTYPAKDARDFAASLANQKDGQYGDVEIRTLTDAQATERAIKHGLDWLTKQVTNQDVGLVYLAGHGMLDERDRFYFLAADSDAARLRATAVPRDDIADTLDALPGKALLFLDACHAGAVVPGRRDTLNVNAVVNDLADTEHGVTVFAASTGRQLSQENSAWGNGAFTKAVVEGLGGPGGHAKADLLGKGTITTSALDVYVSARVKDLTDGGQSPVMIRPATVPDFPLAVAR